jgi:hypothetical protein
VCWRLWGAAGWWRRRGGCVGVGVDVVVVLVLEPRRSCNSVSPVVVCCLGVLVFWLRWGGVCLEVFGNGGGWLRWWLAEVFLGLCICPGAPERARY